MKQFGVSRTTIREAIRVLAYLGQVEVRQGCGTFVRQGVARIHEDILLNAETRDVYQVRRALEGEIVRSAASMRSERDLANLALLIKALERSFDEGALDVFCRLDIEIYTKLAEITENSILIDLYRSFSSVLCEPLARTMRCPDVPQLCLERHRRVYMAVCHGDSDVAEAAAASALDAVVDRIIANCPSCQEDMASAIRREKP
jgi:DNA-binding FadR family transcriptional regulator